MPWASLIKEEKGIYDVKPHRQPNRDSPRFPRCPSKDRRSLPGRCRIELKSALGGDRAKGRRLLNYRWRSLKRWQFDQQAEPRSPDAIHETGPIRNGGAPISRGLRALWVDRMAWAPFAV